MAYHSVVLHRYRLQEHGQFIGATSGTMLQDHSYAIWFIHEHALLGAVFIILREGIIKTDPETPCHEPF